MLKLSGANIFDNHKSSMLTSTCARQQFVALAQVDARTEAGEDRRHSRSLLTGISVFFLRSIPLTATPRVGQSFETRLLAIRGRTSKRGEPIPERPSHTS
jgi:hypothetical protein